VKVTTAFLSDYRIDDCDGCMRCVFKGIKCHLDDDFYTLAQTISSHSCFIVIAPAYVLSIPGSLKSFLDRFLLFLPFFRSNYGKRGASIGIASLAAWEHFHLPYLNLLLMSLGFTVAESKLFMGAGPGEVLLDDEINKKVEDIIDTLLSNKDIEYTIQGTVCPVCRSRVFELQGDELVCPFCWTKGVRTGDTISFSDQSIKNHRFTKEQLEDHFNDWILKTEGVFRDNLREILKRRRALLG
jgi:multimeric flavodoxin WrbA